MKRKDWKIKKLKKNIFGKHYYVNSNRYFFYKRRKIFFLRKLFLKKNRVLFKKNLIPNYIFYKFFLNSFDVYKNTYINFYIYKNLYKYFYMYPHFFVSKKINNLYNFSLNYKNNNVNFFFLKNSFNHKNIYGVNVVVFNDFISSKHKELNNNLLAEEKEKNLFIKKYETSSIIIDEKNLNNLSNFNYSLNLIIYINIYKIIILLHINFLIK